MTRLAVIGVGHMGAEHARNIQEMDGVELVSVLDADARRARQLAQALDCHWTSQVEELLADDRLDGVVIASSSDSHAALIKACARAGKGMLCEKPIALTRPEVESCLSDLDTFPVPFVLGFNRRFDPAFRAVKRAFAEGRAGKAELLCIHSRDALPPPPAYVRLSGGIFRDMMIHDFDMATWLLDEEVEEVFATGSCLVDPAIAEAGDIDTALVTLKMRSGALVQINNSRRSPVGYDQRLELMGDQALLRSEDFADLLQPGSREEAPGAHFPQIYNRYHQSYQAILKHFVDCLHGWDSELPARAGLRSLALADAAARSLESGAPCRVRDSLAPA
jgi:myo-inositol 2-dehydrogenase/D-chiro-inositol 1-dehydrogenase